MKWLHSPALALLLILSGNAAQGALRPRYGGELRFPVAEPVVSLDPLRLRYESERQVAACVFEGLAAYDRDGRAVPALAAYWTSERSDSLWSFVLKHNAQFSTGERVTSWDVKRSWEALLTPLEHLAARWLLDVVAGSDDSLQIRAGEVSGLRALDDRTLEVRLKRAVPNFPEYLTDLSCAVVAKRSMGHPVGSGPFAIASHAPDSVVLVPNPFRREGRPYLSRVCFSRVPAARYAECRAGGFDLCPEFAFDDLDLRAAPAWVNVRQHRFFESYHLMINTDHSPLDSPLVRERMAQAINKNDLLEVCGRDGYVAERIFPVEWPTQGDRLGVEAPEDTAAWHVGSAEGSYPLEATAEPETDSVVLPTVSMDSTGLSDTTPDASAAPASDTTAPQHPTETDTPSGLGPEEPVDTTASKQRETTEVDSEGRRALSLGRGIPTPPETLTEYIFVVRGNYDTDQRIAAQIQRVLEGIGLSMEVVALEPEAFRLAQRDSLYDLCLDLAVAHFRDAALSYGAFLAYHGSVTPRLQELESDLAGALDRMTRPYQWIPLLHLNAYFVEGPRVTGVESLPTGQLGIADAWLMEAE